MRNVIAAISAAARSLKAAEIRAASKWQAQAVQCSGSRCETPPSVSHSHSLFDRKLISRGEHCTYIIHHYHRRRVD